MWMKARVVLVIETISIAGLGSNIRAIGLGATFASNRNVLAPFRQSRQKSVLPPGAAIDATRTRRLVLFCAVPT